MDDEWLNNDHFLKEEESERERERERESHSSIINKSDKQKIPVLPEQEQTYRPLSRKRKQKRKQEKKIK